MRPSILPHIPANDERERERKREKERERKREKGRASLSFDTSLETALNETKEAGERGRIFVSNHRIQ